MDNKNYKCPICNKRFRGTNSLYSHVGNLHSSQIPPNFTPSRFLFYLRTGKENGTCVVCKKDTGWNETTNKYHRFCKDPKCKETYIKEFRERMISKYGKVNLLNDPEQQRKMLSKRKISGEYKWSDGTSKVYTGTYELDCLKFLDLVMGFESRDVMTPSPHNYTYTYKGERKFYIPDIYIPSLNLEIEIKASDNTHHKIQEVDKVKERLKDEVLLSNKNINYVKIFDKDYSHLLNKLLEMKTDMNKEKPLISEPLEECMKSIDLAGVDLYDLSESMKMLLEEGSNFYHIDPLDEKRYFKLFILLLSEEAYDNSLVSKLSKGFFSNIAISFNPQNELYIYDNGTFTFTRLEDLINKIKFLNVTSIMLNVDERERMESILQFYKMNNSSKSNGITRGSSIDITHNNPKELIHFLVEQITRHIFRKIYGDDKHELLKVENILDMVRFNDFGIYNGGVIKNESNQDKLSNIDFVTRKNIFHLTDLKHIFSIDEWKTLYENYRNFFIDRGDNIKIFIDMISLILENSEDHSNKTGFILEEMVNIVDTIRKLSLNPSIKSIDVKNSHIIIENKLGVRRIEYPIKDFMLNEINLGGVMYSENISLNEKKSLREVVRILSTFHNGIWDRFHKLVNIDPEPYELVNVYKSMSIEEMEKYRVGLSWDLSSYLYRYIKTNYEDLNVSQYMIELGELETSYHSFNVVEHSGKYYLMEVVYKGYVGIHEFENIKEVFKQVISMVSHEKIKNIIKIYKYEDIEEGMNIVEIIDRIERTGSLVFES